MNPSPNHQQPPVRTATPALTDTVETLAGSDSAPQNEATTTTRVERALAAAGRSRRIVDADTARLIAAATHPGQDSALARFAATGDLNARAALVEAEQHRHPSVPMHWLLTLQAYLLTELQANANKGGGRHGTA